jgi:type I restriction-modification system DNA methylase subunit
MKTHCAEFDKKLERLSRRRHRWEAFSDFCEASAIAIANSMALDELKEEQYKRIAAKYERDEFDLIVEMFATVVLALDEERDQDFLGAAFMRNELGNHWAGQFFTPYEVARMMSAVVGADAKSSIEENGFIKVMEPACGAGGMVIATSESLREQGIDMETQVHFTAIDVSAVCAHMAYIQLSLLAIPAVVVHGNALSQETYGTFVTPAHHLFGWDWRLRSNRAAREETPEPGLTVEIEKGQMALW